MICPHCTDWDRKSLHNRSRFDRQSPPATDLYFVFFVSQEKQAPSSKNMEPEESTPLATDPSDGVPGSKNGDELRDDGSKPGGSSAAAVAAEAEAALVPEGSTKLQEGGGTIEGWAQQNVEPVTDDASDDAVATKGETPTKEISGLHFRDGATAAEKVPASTAAATVGATESPSSSEPKGNTEETEPATGARSINGVAGASGVPENTTTGTGGPGDGPSTDGVANLEAFPRKKTEAEANNTPTATAPPRGQNEAEANNTPPATVRQKKAVTSGSGAALPASLLTKEAPHEGKLDSTVTAKTEEPTGGVLTERKGVENSTAEGVGGGAAGGGSVSPTPPRTRSNPISRGTPPQRGSRGGNLAICTQQSYSPGREDGWDWSKPTSPRSRPRDQPLVRAKNDGGDGSGDDDEDAAGVTKEKVASFSSRRWKASDEYVLDEDR